MSELEVSVSCPPQCAETDNIKNTDDINPETVQNTYTNISQVEEGFRCGNDFLKGLLTDNFCHVCEATLIHESQRVSHYEGKKHAQRVRMYLNKKAKVNKQRQDSEGLLRGLSAEKFCELCSMVFSSPTVAKSHYEGKVHAKNLKKNTPPPPGSPVIESTAPVPIPSEVTVQNQISQEERDSSALGDQEVDLSDPNKYCTLCSASFNNPLVAQQHYSGRKHQRNQARQEMLDQMGEQSEQASSLTCPICCLTLNSIEMYQAHMQGNKHLVKEKKVKELCKSQKKVYDSFQDELADYIQVQKARGLEPKAGMGSTGQASKVQDEIGTEAQMIVEEIPHTHPGHVGPRFPPPGFPRPHWHPQFQTQVNQFGFGMRGPVPHYRPGYVPHTRPHFTPGQLHKRGRSPESLSSSFSDSSSYSSSSSDRSSSSDDSREKRRRKRKMRKRGKSRRDQEGVGGETERSERKKRWKGDRRGSVEKEEDKNKKWDERRKGERCSNEDDESRSKRRSDKKNRRHGDGQHVKRRKEEELLGKQEVEVQVEEVQGRMEEHVEEQTETKDGKQKHRKERKKGKEKVNQEDNRTEEERLWDETILGVF